MAIRMTDEQYSAIVSSMNREPWNGSCYFCGSAVARPKASHLSNGEGKYCSRTCAAKHKSKIRRDARMTSACRQCNAPMRTPKPSAIAAGEGKYCSNKCRVEHLKVSGVFAGQNNPRYIDGKGKERGCKKWRENNKDAVAAHNRNTKTRRESVAGSHSKSDIDALFARQNGQCAVCKACLVNNGCHVDHIIPIARGGSNYVGNIQLLCSPCNLHKHVAIPIEFRRKHGLLKTNEDKEQAALFEWAAMYSDRFPELDMLFHVGNGGYRHKTTAMRLMLIGLRPGVPDLVLPSRKGTLFIELKAGKNKATTLQKSWIDVLNAAGNRAVVCNGWVAAAREIISHLCIDLVPPDTDFEHPTLSMILASESQK